MKKVLYHTSRIFLGIVFLFSGFVKAVDPMGTAIKFSDYFNYAFYLPSLEPLALPLALFLCALEFSLGFLLIMNLMPKFTAWTTLGLMAFFTPLTFYLAIANPVSDCGCFGDAVKLTNWQTFWKNIVIDIFLSVFFYLRNDFPSFLKQKTQQIITTIVFLAVIGFELYNYSFLPIIDFRPYKVGTNIPEQMQIPDDAPKDEYETTFIYKNLNTGELKEFSEENYPWDDTLNWQWVETKTKLIKKGYVPPIHDFQITDTYDNDLTEEILNYPDTVLLVVTYSFEKLNFSNLQKMKNFIDTLQILNPNIKVYCLTSSSNEKIDEVKEELENPDWTFCKIDEVTSKTIIRSNPGLVVLYQGTILQKIPYHSLNSHQMKLLMGVKKKMK